MSFSYIFKRMMLVHKCTACRRILSLDEFEKALCADCELAYRVAKTESCPSCFRSAIECTCQPKMLSNAGSLCLRKLYFYHPGKEKLPQNRLIYFLKHNTTRRGVSLVARDLWTVISKELEALEIENIDDEVLFVNVPRGRKAVMRDGFDQAAEICKKMSELSGAPYAPAIKRRIGGKEQKKLTAQERKRNIKSLIRLNEGCADAIKGKYVILLDDIVTTGASMAACLPMLRKMEARGVICCAIALDLKKK